MTRRENCLNIISQVPEEQLHHFEASLIYTRKLIEEILDDAYCLALYEHHMKTPDREDDFIPIEDVAAELGIKL